MSARQLQVFERNDDGSFTGRAWTIDDDMWEALRFEDLAAILGPPTSQGVVPASAIMPVADVIAQHGGITLDVHEEPG